MIYIRTRKDQDTNIKAKHLTSSNKLQVHWLSQHTNTIFSSRWNGETFRTVPQSFRRDVPSACYPPEWRLISSLNIGRWMFSILKIVSVYYHTQVLSGTCIIYSIIIHEIIHHIYNFTYIVCYYSKVSVWYRTCDTFTARPLPWAHPRRRRPMNGRPPPWRYARRELAAFFGACLVEGLEPIFHYFSDDLGCFFHPFPEGFGYNLI